MIPYILYVGLIIFICLLFYKVFLQKATFFRVNRLVLVASLAFAFVLPLINIPQELSFTRKPGNTATASANDADISPNEQLPGRKTSLLKPDTRPLNNTTTVATLPLKAIPPTQPLLLMQRIMHWLTYAYWAGVILFGLYFLL